jgi:DNA-binding NarL/FixJ family response regulator
MDKKGELIYMADDHLLVAQGVANLLHEIGFLNVKIFSSGKELYKAVLHEKPDFIFLDIYMGDWDGIHTLLELRTKGYNMPCLMLSMVAEKKIIDKCIENGANAFIHKSCDGEELELAIKEIKSGKKFISASLTSTKKIGTIQQTQSGIKLTDPLTEREKEILALFCDGLDMNEIANLLHLSHHTIETHKKKMLLKFQVGSTSKMIALAFKNKLI